MASKKGKEYTVDGRKMVFDYPYFRERYDLLIKRGEKTAMIKMIAERTGCPFDTVNGWIKRNNSPENVKSIYIMEEIFKVPRGSFLRPVKGEDEVIDMDKMSNIPDFERNAARKLYEEMCDLIHEAEYLDDVTSFCLYGAGHSGGSGNELRREQRILAIRKSGFDIPKDIRTRLINFVNKIYGPWNIDDNDMYFRADEYQEYLTKNQFEDTEEIRYIYGELFVANLYTELDEIFARYRQK